MQNPLCDNIPSVLAKCDGTRNADSLCELVPGLPATKIPTLAISAVAYLCNVSMAAMTCTSLRVRFHLSFA